MSSSLTSLALGVTFVGEQEMIFFALVALKTKIGPDKSLGKFSLIVIRETKFFYCGCIYAIRIKRFETIGNLSWVCIFQKVEIDICTIINVIL